MKNNKFNQKRNRNKCENEHLLCCIVMTSTQLFPPTVSKQLNEDNQKTGAFRRDILNRFSIKDTA